MPRTKEQYEAMRMATREKIQSAAIKLFTQKGFSATSVQDIANKAQVSTGLMYRHYKSKDHLFNELVNVAATGLKENVEMFQSDASPTEIIQRLTLEILNDLNKNEQFSEFLMLMNQASTMENPPPEVKFLNEQSEAMLNQLAILIKKGQTLGQFKDGDEKEMAFFYLATLQGLTNIRLTMKERFISPNPKIVMAFLMKEANDDGNQTSE
ncbi:TetR family transcriptional regulator [Alkalihalobacillus alcalophilus ATCC 27647 = CGMCC 1.3604]|uniref:TetR family transcriptional regulator n=1 Tax=Alkalihalobacillus alcalophilus ATCC 27647 = CGMCC 1.3604 TaxID=1218173 RepID=A0A094YXZ2_ALKAL|nr:TetR/AcrR family transcriptional regulator [Alkalihalobacillus alcalophilus]KGA98407.1 TetR family transcriptional regulator [Alkalihalobacillus alcalophilus ATCC 27647 = CGMCC 1.3604]MED1563944.1 TetR/AcrR family transcriptional regulator [Alkalihalobacillus alcalophilus]THG91571.1 TetR family transcriptional regulator [Alkalihalobacillus alcalophilus ATCC 27647 = CGMCC 1.3604]